jgi:6-phosphogluconolactonase (cycloisomerase 2 family)
MQLKTVPVVKKASFLLLLLSLMVVFGNLNLALADGDDEDNGPSRAAVYTLTNAPSGNAVAIFQRAEDGKLTFAGAASTNGLGTGAGLGSQAPVILSEDGRWLLAVNPGSNSVAAFKVLKSGQLSLTGTISSGGTMPISLTFNKDLLYVLNAGGSGNISGFKLDKTGHLSALANSTQPLSGPAVGPAQVSFTPNGKMLVVTEKATNQIAAYSLDKNGLPGQPKVTASAGATPFGFAFARENYLVVSEAFGGAVNGSAASSYKVEKTGSIKVISASEPTHQTAACWVAVTPDGKYAYTANAGSSSVTGYRVTHDGKLVQLNPQTGVTGSMPAGSGPQDMAVSKNGHFLYVTDGRIGKIAGFKVESNGQLTSLGEFGNLSAGIAGTAAR